MAEVRSGNDKQMAAELADMKLLQAMSTQLAQEQELESLYEKVLDSAVAIMHSDFASMQMLYPERGNGGELRLLASRGFNEEAARRWEWVSSDSRSSCSAALRKGARVIVNNVEKWDFVAGTEGLAAYLRVGIHAMQSTPLISRSGKIVGMISTHWRTPHRPTERELDLFDILARQATELIEHKKADEELRESEERFRALVMASSDVIYHVSPDWKEMRRLDGKGFLTDTLEPDVAWIDKYVYPDDRKKVREAIRDSLRNKSRFELEHRVYRADGRVGWTHSQAVPLLDRNDEIVEWFGAATEITERRQSEIMNGRLAAIVESSDDAIVSKDLNGTITSWNKSAERLFGYPAEEAIGQHITLIIPSERGSEEETIINKIRRGERIEHLETVRLRKDGGEIEVSLTISPIRDAAGRIVGASKIARDISEQRQTERLLQENEQRLLRTEKLAAAGQLAASLAHEINNPLSSVTNVLYLLNANEDVSGEARNLVRTAATELARVTRIVKQSLSYYRVGVVAKQVDLGSVMEESLQIFRERFARAGIQVRTRTAPDARIIGFPDEIRQVIDNLLLNAIEATSGGGQIAISVQPAWNWNKDVNGVRLTIADNGCGIPQQSLAHIFEPFFTTKAERGTGLGLWVVHGIVAKHEGRIKIRSTETASRHGTTISILWPSSGQAMSAKWSESAA